MKIKEFIEGSVVILIYMGSGIMVSGVLIACSVKTDIILGIGGCLMLLGALLYGIHIMKYRKK